MRKFSAHIALIALLGILLTATSQVQGDCDCNPEKAESYLLEKDHPCRIDFVKCAVNAPSEEYVSTLSAIIREHTDNMDACATAVYALGEMRQPDAVPVLIKFLDHSFLGAIKDIPYMKADPPSALIKIGEPSLEPLLQSLEKYTEPQIRQTMGSMVYQICQSKAGAIDYLSKHRHIHPQGVDALINWVNQIKETI